MTSEPERISPMANRLISEESTELFLSAASAWELSIKYAKGRLDLEPGPAEFLPRWMSTLGIQPMLVHIEHAVRVAELPTMHRDPFDRMLIAQAQIEALPIITSDRNIARYDVETIW
jgi:PIN domain nuclease of toxin-antitoxin system